MVKVACESCGKRCKGQAVKLPQDKYFHLKCFKCKECSKQLTAQEFYSRDGAIYCAADFRKLFAVHCRACHQIVEGEVVTVLENSFHPDCCHCSRCGGGFAAGDKVTYNGTELLCHGCVVAATSAPERPTYVSPVQSVATRPQGIPVSDQLHSPDSDFSTSGLRDESGLGRTPLSPTSVTSGYKSDASYDQTPDKPRADGVFSSSTSYSNADSRGFLSPHLHFMQYRSMSPISTSSRKSRESSASPGRGTPDFGKFYKTTYMELKDGYKRGPSINADTSEKLPQHFHRPDGFSYRKIRTDILKPAKKGSRSLFSFKTHTRTEPYKPVKTQEAIQLAKLPDAQLLDKGHMRPIERDDWPSPPATAAAFPELLREGRVRRLSGQSDVVDDKENELVPVKVDPQIEKDIEELSKLRESGAASVILKDLQRRKSEEQVLDPRSASRTPSAAAEPYYRTRYESPIFASPSRDLDLRQQLPSLDESFTEPKYRTPSPANFLFDRHFQHRVSADNVVQSLPAPRPGYGLRSYMSDSRNEYLSDVTDSYFVHRPGSSSAILEHTSCYSSQSDIADYDPTTGLRRNSRLRSTAMSDGRRTPYSLLHGRSVPSLFKADEPVKIYPYEQLRLTNHTLPPGVDKNALEQYLSREEFEELFHMTPEEFYFLAEWKRNDLKKRVELF